ncbi:MAG TPA: hypothetical protein VIB07_00380 [Nitrososphaera sp.]
MAGLLQPSAELSLPSLDLSRPVFINSEGEAISQAAAGQQIVTMLSIRNNIYNEEKPMVVIFEVRDGNGVSVHLAWQSTIVSYDDTYDAGFSWIVPYESAPGAMYSARTFAITGFGNDALALSNVFESNLKVIP